MVSSRYWCITSFDLVQFPQNVIEQFEFKKVTYYVLGKEMCPTTKRLHWQAYVELDRSQKMSWLKNNLSPTAHLKMRNDDIGINASDYCKKGIQSHAEWSEFNIEGPNFGVEAEFIEDGTLSTDVQGKRNDLLEIQQLMMRGKTADEIAGLYFTQWVMYNRSLEKYAVILRDKRPRTWNTEVIVLWGPTNCGKTYTAIKENGAVPCKFVNKFMIGYENDPVVVFEEFAPEKMSREDFLDFTGEFRIPVNTKNGHTEWNPRKLYITSNLDPANWYMNDDGGVDYAIQRRYDEVIHMVTPYEKAKAVALDCSTCSFGIPDDQVTMFDVAI